MAHKDRLVERKLLHFKSQLKVLWDKNQRLSHLGARCNVDQKDQWLKDNLVQAEDLWVATEREELIKQDNDDVSTAINYLQDAINKHDPASHKGYKPLSLEVRCMYGIIGLYNLENTKKNPIVSVQKGLDTLETVTKCKNNPNIGVIPPYIICEIQCITALHNLFEMRHNTAITPNLIKKQEQLSLLDEIIDSGIKVDHPVYQEALYRKAIAQLVHEISLSPSKQILGIKNLRAAAASGHLGAKAMFGTFLFGRQQAADVRECLKYLKESAAAGHAQSEYLLGIVYYQGIVEAKNLSTSHKYLKLAQQHGYSKKYELSQEQIEKFKLRLDNLLNTVKCELDIQVKEQLVNIQKQVLENNNVVSIASHVNDHQKRVMLQQLQQKMAALFLNSDIPPDILKENTGIVFNNDIFRNFNQNPHSS